MLARVWACAALLALAAATQDFEFDDTDAETETERRPRRYVYDPHSPLCRALVCKKREVCLLRDSFTALCATKKDILRKGDVIVPAGSSGAPAEGEDDVFYDGGGDGDEVEPGGAPERCVGCGGGARAQFLCGSDNRTYSSLCRLDLHNCVRRPAPPVKLACRGFCPCTRRREGRRRPAPSENEVLPARRHPAPPAPPAPCALDKMADRLLDWFSVLMEEARASPPPPAGFPGGCKPEVRWMFAHLDGDGDGLLSGGELYALRHDERERCLRPFLASCGGAGGGGVSRGAWCGCLRRAARPCAALARAARAHGGWAPACDARGFYRPRQCHAALAVCWCVDAHGQELPGSRAKGEPPCPRAALRPRPTAPRTRSRPAAPAPHDDEDDAPASGDGELRY